MKKYLKFVTILFAVVSVGYAIHVNAGDEGHGGTITFTKPTSSVVFDHKTHIDMGFDCDSCHEKLFEYKRSAEDKADFNMASMYAGKYCGGCHNGNTAFASNTKCGSCHNNVKSKIVFTKPVKAVIFDHKAHIEMVGDDCASCHDSVFPSDKKSEAQADFTMDSLYKGKYCGKCHDGNMAFASNTKCATCHIGVKGYNRMFKTEKAAHKGH